MSDSTSKRYLHLVSDATLIELRLHLVSDATPIELRFNWYQTQRRQIQNQAQLAYLLVSDSWIKSWLPSTAKNGIRLSTQLSRSEDYHLRVSDVTSEFSKETPNQALIYHEYQVSSFDSTSSCDNNKVLRWRPVFKSNYDESRSNRMITINISEFKIQRSSSMKLRGSFWRQVQF